VRFETRSGNLDRARSNWSPWAPLDAAGSRVASPSARFLQYRVTLAAAPDGRSPEVREIEIAYMAKNVAPVIEEIEITPANYRFPQSATPATPAPATISLPALGQRRRSTSLSLDTSSSQSMQYAKGYAGVRWAVTDPNADQMIYKVEIRGVQEQEWKLLREKLKEKYLSWDSTAFADGEHIIRITATDLPDNPADQALSTQLESERFTIDNTPPQIANLTGSRSGNTLNIRWKARDERSTIQRAEYSANGREWVVVQPTTRLSDSPEHEYTLMIEATGGEQTVAVRVSDEFDNQSVDKVIIR
jgi:hypothetical protein